MATLYYDLGSPYAYLSVERASAVLPTPPRLRPVLAGAIFNHRGHGSWGHTDARAANQAEIEARAVRYGLAPIQWPPGWPPNTLQAMRAIVWAQQAHGAGDAFARTAFRAAFVEGADLGDPAVLATIADRTGLPAQDLAAGIADPAVKDALRAATDAAIALGVRGVPTLALDDGLLLFGDDRLDEAA
ncbi:MAG TPA: DsbA family protein [Baekduia sp.]|nr:DsbA family protein [Baekduia sp.]